MCRCCTYAANSKFPTLCSHLASPMFPTWLPQQTNKPTQAAFPSLAAPDMQAESPLNHDTKRVQLLQVDWSLISTSRSLFPNDVGDVDLNRPDYIGLIWIIQYQLIHVTTKTNTFRMGPRESPHGSARMVHQTQVARRVAQEPNASLGFFFVNHW